MSKQPYYPTINASVRIRPVMQESAEYHGKTGTLVQIDEHASDGDAFGVAFEDEPTRVVFFWRRELAVIEGEQKVSSNVDSPYQRIIGKYGEQPLARHTMAPERNPNQKCDRCQQATAIATVTAARTQDHYCEQCLTDSIEALRTVDRLLGR